MTAATFKPYKCNLRMPSPTPLNHIFVENKSVLLYMDFSIGGGGRQRRTVFDVIFSCTYNKIWRKNNTVVYKNVRYSCNLTSIYSSGREKKKSGRPKNVYAISLRPRGYSGFSGISPKADNKNRIINPFTRSSSHPRIILLLGKH